MIRKQFGSLVSSVLADSERKSWERQEDVSYDIFHLARGKAGREYYLKLNKVQQSDRMPSGISEADALAIGHRVFRVTTIRERIK